MKKTPVLLCAFLLCGCQSAERSELNTEDHVVSTTTDHTASAPETTEGADSAITPFDMITYLSASDLLIQYYELSSDTGLLTFLDKNDYRNEILDFRSGKIIEELHTQTVPNIQSNGFWVFEKGDTFQYFDPEFNLQYMGSIAVYDYDGNLLRSFPIDAAPTTECITYDISTDTLFYDALESTGNDSQYCIYQKKTEAEPKALFSCSVPAENCLTKVYSLQKTNESLLFKGLQSLDQSGSKTASCYGMIDLNTQEMQIRTVNIGDADVRSYASGAFVCENNIPYGVQPSGMIHWMKDGAITEQSLEYKQECIHAEVSLSGMYYVTQLNGEDQDGKQVIRITVYDANGTKMKAEEMTFTEHKDMDAIFISESFRKLYCRMIQPGGSTSWFSMDF